MEALIVIEADAVTSCKNGHLMTPDNIGWYVAGKSRQRYPRCQTCRRESVRRSRARLSEAVAPNTASIKQQRDAENYESLPLFSLIGKPVRDDIAAVLGDDTVDQLQRNVIRRVAYKRRGWKGAPPDVAERWFIEGLIAETIDARSRLLAITTLLRLIFGP